MPSEPGPAPSGPSAPTDVPAVVPEPHACGLEFAGLAVYQGVKVSLLDAAGLVAQRNAPIIEGRRAYFRTFVRYPVGAAAGNVTARLIVSSSAGPVAFSAQKKLFEDSTDGSYDTTLDFDVPGEHVLPDSAVSLELDVGASCPGGGKQTFPATGALPLDAVSTGTLRIRLVPVAYEADGSGRLPDLSPEQITGFHDWLMALYPTKAVEIEVREAVRTDMVLTRGDGWEPFLDALRSLRTQDGATADIYYYGLVSPAESFSTYCRNACTAGLSYLASRPTASLQVGAGVGFSGEIAGETLVHEVGHQHGRGHTACGGGAGVDANFPYPSGSIGVWGLDFRTMRLQSPGSRKDLMGYCQPQWISDYTFGKIAQRRSEVSLARVFAAEPLNIRPAGYRSAIVDAAGGLRLGHPLPAGAEPAGSLEIAEVLDAQGRVVAEVAVYRTPFGHGAGFALDLPEPQAHWTSLRLADARTVSLLSGRPIPRFEPILPGGGSDRFERR